MFAVKDAVDIGSILLEDGHISIGQLLEALDKRLQNGHSILRNLINSGHTDDDTVIRCLSKYYAIPQSLLDSDDSAFYLINVIERCRRSQYTFMPINFMHSVVMVGLRNTPDEATLKSLEDITGLRVKLGMLLDDENEMYITKLFDNLDDGSLNDYARSQEDYNIRLPGYEGRERRRHPRFTKALRIKYDLNSEYNINRTVNISVCGALMKSSSPAPVDSYLVIRMELPTTYKELVIVVKVVRVERVLANRSYMVALDFYSMDISEKRKISEYLNSMKE